MTRTDTPSAAALVLLGVVGTIAVGMPPASGQAATPSTQGAKAGAALGLGGLDGAAERYGLAPSSRTVRPTALGDTTRVNVDYVTASSLASEEAGHDLEADPGSSRVKVGGVMVRRAGPGEPSAEFTYTMQAPRGDARTTLRIEEAGAEASRYDVRVNGVTVHRRAADPGQRGEYGGSVGLVHYEIAVPRSVPRRKDGTMRVRFVNAEQPGPGARIAGVWANADGGSDPAAPFGGTVVNAKALVDGGTTTLRTDVLGRPYAVVDFGREVGGKVSVDARRLSGAPKVAFAFSESERFMTSASDFSADPVGVATETQTVKVGAGRTTLTPPDRRGGFRYLMVQLSAAGAVELSNLRLDFEAAPQQEDLRDYAGSFRSADEELNRFWYAGAYTVQLSTIDPHTGRRYPAQPGPVRNDAQIGDGPSVIVDAPKRDRFIWGGDLVIANPVAYITTRDEVSTGGAFDWLAREAGPDGQPTGVYLPLDDGTGWSRNWGEYAGWWIVNLEQHVRYTGDRAFLGRHYPALKAAIGWYESRVAPDGLVDMPGSAGGHWGYGHAGKESYNSALYVYALEHAARLAALHGDAALAADWRAQAARTRAAIDRDLYDPEAGAYVLGPNDRSHPQDANTMAILSGVATGERADAVRRFLKRSWTPFGSPTTDVAGTVPRYISPFVSTFELEAFAQKDPGASSDDALEVLRRTWGHMLKGDTTGTFWENVSLGGGPQLGSYTSYAHGWSAAPTTFLTQTLLGVTPTGPAYADFSVRPHPGSKLPWAQGTVPTPKGEIGAAWRRDGARFSLAVRPAAATTGEVAIPASPRGVVRRDGQVIWSDGAARAPGVTRAGGYVVVPGVTQPTVLTADEPEGATR